MPVQVRYTLQRATAAGFKLSEPKTKASRRHVLLSATAIDALKRHQVAQWEERATADEGWEDHNFVFANTVGRPINPSNLLIRSYRPLLSRAGLPKMRFHDLRHTAASLMLRAGVNPKVVQEILGHADIAITLNLYSHVMPTMQRNAVEALDALLTQPLAVNLAVNTA